MRIKFLFTPLVLALGLFACPQSRADEGAHFYVQPGFAFVAVGKDFKPAVAVTAAAGASFGVHHSVEAEYIRFETEEDVRWPTYELKFSIVLATYKYAFRLRHGLSVYAGASLGSMKQSVSAKSGYVIFGDPSDNTTAFGLSGGVTYSLNANIHFDVGTRFIATKETRFTTGGSLTLLQSSVRFQF